METKKQLRKDIEGLFLITGRIEETCRLLGRRIKKIEEKVGIDTKITLSEIKDLKNE